MICKNCGSEVNGLFCPNCGNKVEEEKKSLYDDPTSETEVGGEFSSSFPEPASADDLSPAETAAASATVAASTAATAASAPAQPSFPSADAYQAPQSTLQSVSAKQGGHYDRPELDPQAQTANSAATAALILGIIAVVLLCGYYVGLVVIILAAIGLSKASKAKKLGNTSGKRTVGFVLSLLGLIGGIIECVAVIVMIVVAIFGITAGYKEAKKEIEENKVDEKIEKYIDEDLEKDLGELADLFES